MTETERPAGWFTDPLGRYDHRYWDGGRWTDDVARGGERTTDPEGVAISPPAVVAATAATPASPSSSWAPPPPPPARRAAWPWALAAALAAFVIGVGGCVAVSLIVTDRVADELRERRDRHAITVSQYEEIELGMTRAEVIAALGKEPQSPSELVAEGVFDEPPGPDCISYLEEGDIFFPTFQFCFDEDGVLASKSAR